MENKLSSNDINKLYNVLLEYNETSFKFYGKMRLGNKVVEICIPGVLKLADIYGLYLIQIKGSNKDSLSVSYGNEASICIYHEGGLKTEGELLDVFLESLESDIIIGQKWVPNEELHYTFEPKRELKSIIELFKKIQTDLIELDNNRINPEISHQLFQIFETFKTPLLYAWNKLKYGHHSDFWDEGESMFNFISFASSPQEEIKKIIEAWDSNPPFELLGSNRINVGRQVRIIYEKILKNELE